MTNEYESELYEEIFIGDKKLPIILLTTSSKNVSKIMDTFGLREILRYRRRDGIEIISCIDEEKNDHFIYVCPLKDIAVKIKWEDCGIELRSKIRIVSLRMEVYDKYRQEFICLPLYVIARFWGKSEELVKSILENEIWKPFYIA